MHKIGFCGVGKQLHRQMRDAAGAEPNHCYAFASGLCIGDKFSARGCGIARIHYEQLDAVDHQGH